MRNSPSLWGGGVEWAPVATEQASGYWQSGDTPTTTSYTGVAVPSVAIGGVRQTGTDASWSLGRSGWLSTLSPNTASVGIVGATNAMPGDALVISVEVDDAVKETHPPPLWMGTVDSVTQDTATDGSITSTVTATDAIGALGRAEAPTSVSSGTLKEVAETLAADAGIPLIVETSDTLPTLLADGSVDESVLSYINRAELSSNALLFLRGDGRLVAVIRQASALSEVDVVLLTGDDAPRRWTTSIDLDQVVNEWYFASDLAGGWSSLSSVPSTKAIYGARRFSVTDMLAASTSAWADLRDEDVLATPRTTLDSAEFPVSMLSRAALWLDPLDWVDLDSTTWQVMSVQHQATTREWMVTITGDQTQSFILGDTDPDYEEEDPEGPTTTITETYVSTKSATAFRSSGGSYYGNGAGSRLAVGYYGGGRARTFIQFPVDWDDFPGFVRVKSAKLRLRSGTQSWVAFGSAPKVYVQRVTESWSEGSYDASPPSQYSASNALVWPGPSRTTSGQATRTFGSGEGNWSSTDVTAIAQAWRSSGNNYGLCVRAVNEDTSSQAYEFYSDDTGSEPELVLTCEVS